MTARARDIGYGPLPELGRSSDEKNASQNQNTPLLTHD
jgi:hypothetical protein